MTQEPQLPVDDTGPEEFLSKYIDVAEATRRLRRVFGKISYETVRRWCRQGILHPVTKPGGRTLYIPRTEIEAIERGERPDMHPGGRRHG
jgi:hypothetical protein